MLWLDPGAFGVRLSVGVGNILCNQFDVCSDFLDIILLDSGELRGCCILCLLVTLTLCIGQPSACDLSEEQRTAPFGGKPM